jgi:hypothetical protein
MDFIHLSSASGNKVKSARQTIQTRTGKRKRKIKINQCTQSNKKTTNKCKSTSMATLWIKQITTRNQTRQVNAEYQRSRDETTTVFVFEMVLYTIHFQRSHICFSYLC